jgi:hypothetical protein
MTIAPGGREPCGFTLAGPHTRKRMQGAVIARHGRIIKFRNFP